MKKLLLATMLFAAIGCTKSDLPEATNPDASMQKPTKKIVLRASAGAETKLGFADNDKGGIAVTWVKGDRFALYDKTSNKLVAIFDLEEKYAGKTNGEFTSTDKLVENDVYTVVYPAIETATTLTAYKAALAKINQNQKGNENLDHMSKVCGMEMEDYTYTVDSPEGISFKHTKAIMTLKLKKPADYDLVTDGAPAKISYNNGVKNYNLTLTDVADWTDVITAYIMIDPTTNSSIGQDAIITIVTAKGAYTSEAPITKLYEAGKRYTATRTIYSFIRGFTLANANEIPLSMTDITILDFVDDNNTAADFSALRTNIEDAARTDKVTIAMPNAIVIPGGAFTKCKKLKALDLPKVEIIGNIIYSNGAFSDCSALATIAVPKLISIGNFTFYGCSVLATIDAPKLISIGNNAFASCTALTTIDAPKLISIGNVTFYGCSVLATIDAPELISIGENAFTYCYVLATINAPMVTSIGDKAFNSIGISLAGGAISLGTGHDEDITVGSSIFGSAAVEKYDLTLGSGVSGVSGNTWTAGGTPRPFKSIKQQ